MMMSTMKIKLISIKKELKESIITANTKIENTTLKVCVLIVTIETEEQKNPGNVITKNYTLKDTVKIATLIFIIIKKELKIKGSKTDNHLLFKNKKNKILVKTINNL